MKPYFWPQVHAHPKSASHDTSKLNSRDCIVMMPTHCYSDACRQGRIACPTPQACRLAEGDRVQFDDSPGHGAGVLLWPAVVLVALALVWVVAA